MHIRVVFSLIIIILLLCPIPAWADPSISSVSGQWIHGQTVTINGSDFGQKNPAPPLWWDDGEGATVDNRYVMTSGEMTWVTSATLSGSDKHYNDVTPPFAGLDAVTTDENANLQYQSAGFRGMTAPHNYGSTFMAGAHNTQDDCSQQERGANVGISVSDQSTSNVWYTRHYYRLDLNWPDKWGASEGYKTFNWETSSPYGIYQSAPFHYDTISNACQGGWSGLNRHPACGDSWVTVGGAQLLLISFNDNECGDIYEYPIKTFNQNVGNEYFDWVTSERVVDVPNRLHYIKQNNQFLLNNRADMTNFPNCDPQIREGGGTEIGGASFGGFYKHEDCFLQCISAGNPWACCTGPAEGSGSDCGKHVLDDDAYRFFDDVYADQTLSRVMLANNIVYENATITEPQIPVTWTEGSPDTITATVNLGRIAGNTAYLFVFDSSDNRNVFGYPVTLGETDPTYSISDSVTDWESEKVTAMSFIYAFDIAQDGSITEIAPTANTTSSGGDYTLTGFTSDDSVVVLELYYGSWKGYSKISGGRLLSPE